MSITGVVEHKGWLISSTDEGTLIGWPLSPHLSSKFAHNISLLPNTISHSLTSSPLLSMHKHNHQLITYSKSAIYIFEVDTSQSSIINILTIEAHPTISNEDEISCIGVVDETTILIGTQKGMIYVHAHQKQVQIDPISVMEEEGVGLQLEQQQEISVFHASPTAVASITSLLISRASSLLLVSTSSGRILIMSLPLLKINIELELPTKDSSSIRLIWAEDDPCKFYSLHDAYILEWNIKFGQCIGYIPLLNPTSILKMEEDIMISSMSERIFKNNQKSTVQFSASMRRVNVMAKIAKDFWVAAGTDGIADIFSGSNRIMTLFTKKP